MILFLSKTFTVFTIELSILLIFMIAFVLLFSPYINFGIVAFKTIESFIKLNFPDIFIGSSDFKLGINLYKIGLSFIKILKAKGFDVTYVEGETGHNWTAWRDRLADAFIALWK